MDELQKETDINACPHGNFLTSCKECREAKLQIARERVEQMFTDYGTEGKERVGIDIELKDLLTYFLAIDIETDSSCWGHPDRRQAKKRELHYGEQNYLPYVGLTGYLPGNGEDKNGQAVSYTKMQVEKACERMQASAIKINNLLTEFYNALPFTNQLIKLSYLDGMPAATLDTSSRSHYNEDPQELDEQTITEVRNQWTKFIQFIKNYVFQTDT